MPVAGYGQCRAKKGHVQDQVAGQGICAGQAAVEQVACKYLCQCEYQQQQQAAGRQQRFSLDKQFS